MLEAAHDKMNVGWLHESLQYQLQLQQIRASAHVPRRSCPPLAAATAEGCWRIAPGHAAYT